MQRLVSATVAFVLLTASGGCIRTSKVELSILIREGALQAVDTFPARLVIDMGIGQNRELRICEWDSGFLETQIDVNTYPRCPDPITIEALLVPLDGACSTEGIIGATLDWPDDGVVFGTGSLPVFQDDLCEVTEDRQLNIGPLE